MNKSFIASSVNWTDFWWVATNQSDDCPEHFDTSTREDQTADLQITGGPLQHQPWVIDACNIWAEFPPCIISLKAMVFSPMSLPQCKSDSYFYGPKLLLLDVSDGVFTAVIDTHIFWLLS